MNAEEWYAEIKKHTGGMVAFACDVLADRDSQIAGLCTRVDELVARINEVNSEKAEKDAAIRVLNARLIENHRLRDEQSREIERLSLGRAQDKIHIVAQKGHIESLNRVLAETREKSVAATARKQLDDMCDALIYGFFPKGALKQGEVYTCRGEGVWSEPAQQQLGSKAQKQSDVHTCYAPNVWGAAARKGDSETEAAEEVARETESLAHKVETLWRDFTYTDSPVARIRKLEDETVNNRTANNALNKRLDNQVEKLLSLSADVKHASASRKRMHEQIETLEQQRQSDMSWTAGKIGDLRSDIDPLGRCIAALEANIVDVRKVAEGDRFDMRGLAERINKAGIPLP